MPNNQGHTLTNSSNRASRAVANHTTSSGISQPAVTSVQKNVIQLKLEVKGNEIKAGDLEMVEILMDADHVKSKFIRRVGGVKSIAEKYFDSAKDLYDKLRRVHPSVRKIVGQLKEWAADDKEDEQFTSWRIAARRAFSAAEDKQKSMGNLHYPSPPSSPLTVEQQSYVDYLKGPGRIAEHMKPTAKWGENKLNGQIGEYTHQQQLTSTGIPFYDANNALGYNTPGIDTLSDSDRPFGQSKMHLGTTEPAEELLNTYLSHIGYAPEYARKFLTGLFSEKPSAKKMREALEGINEKLEHEQLGKLSEYAAKEKWRVTGKEDSPLDASVGSKGETIHPKPVQLVLGGMSFPVPSDVYDLIPAEYLDWFEKLPYDLNWFRKVKSQMEYKRNMPRKPAEEKDGDYSE